MLGAVVVMGALPGDAGAQSAGKISDSLKKPVTVSACRFHDGRLKPVHGCTSTQPLTATTKAEAGRIITDTQAFHRCQHGARRIEGSYNGSRTVGWGSYAGTDVRKKAGSCPKAEDLQAWFMEDLNGAYNQALNQAQAMKSSNACIVRALTVMNYQMGDVRRKYPDTWKKLQDGALCDVATDILAWSWYRQSCDRTLDTVIALDSVRECKVQQN